MTLLAPEYPGAILVAADNTNYRTASRPTFTLVVVHCTDGHGDPVATAQMWQTPRHGSSAHFVVGQDGTVVQAVALKDVAWHAHAANGVAVGVEHCARTPGELGPSDAGLPYSEAQLQASARLVAWLLNRAGLPCDRQHVMGHAEADPETSHTKCPTGPGFDWGVYMGLVDAELTKLRAC